MLCLGRYERQRVVMTVPPSTEPTRIVVEVLAARGDQRQAKLGFDAPRAVVIDREEVAADRESIAAAAVKPGDVQPLK